MNKARCFSFIIVGILALVINLRAKPEWQGNIDWAAGNSDAGGSVDCPASYATHKVPYCVVAGGRSCVIARATVAAGKGESNYAFKLALLTQCHNEHAAQTISDAGEEQVSQYLVDRLTE